MSDRPSLSPEFPSIPLNILPSLSLERRKQPYYVAAEQGGEVLLLAGLYDVWMGPDGYLHTFTILTTDSSGPLAWLHDRRPVVLKDRDAAKAWLREGVESLPLSGGSEEVGAAKNGFASLLLAPGGSSEHESVYYVVQVKLRWHPVTLNMTDPQYDKADCASDVRKSKGSITSFFGKASSAASKAAGVLPVPASASGTIATDAKDLPQDCSSSRAKRKAKVDHAPDDDDDSKRIRADQ